MLRESDQETIAAISTPIGEGGIGIIRLSGKDALAIADKIFKPKKGSSVLHQKSFTVQLGHVMAVQEGGSLKIVDEALILVMRAPKSYTREDVVEISAHGGIAALRAILELTLKAGARLAARGEFTKRAFLNGRIDFLQAEAVLDLVKAKTEPAREWAVSQLEGGLSNKIKDIKDELLNILSHLEASIDFPEDMPETDPSAKIEERLNELIEKIKIILSSSALGLIAKTGLKIVIAGRPNVGKSSLMNQLTKKNRVIVTPHAGTTRDVVEEEIQIGGFPVRLLDTAGIQETGHPIEREGIKRSKLAVSEADLVLYVLDGSQAMHAEDRTLLSALDPKKRFIVINKSDLTLKLDKLRLVKDFQHTMIAETSCVNENGLSELEEKIFGFITNGKIQPFDVPVITTTRQKDFLEKALKNIDDAGKACRDSLSPELVAVDIRLALGSLGALVGDVLNNDMLECLFNQFCIGK